MADIFYGVSNKGFRCIDTCGVGRKYNKISDKTIYTKFNKLCPINPINFEHKILHFDDCETESLRMIKTDIFTKNFTISTKYILNELLKVDSFPDTLKYLENINYDYSFTIIILDCAWVQFGKDIVDTSNIEDFYIKIYKPFFGDKVVAVREVIPTILLKIKKDNFYEKILKYYALLSTKSLNDRIYHMVEKKINI